MILTCVQCGARYLVPDEAIGTDGRRVRCAKCSHTWHQEPDGTESQTATGTEAGAETGAATGADLEETPQDQVRPEDDDGAGESTAGDGEPVDGEIDESTGTETGESNQAHLQAEHAAKTTSEVRRRVHERTETPNLPAVRRSFPGVRIAGWAAWVLITVGLPVLMATLPRQVMGLWPASEQIYSLVGLAPMVSSTDTTSASERMDDAGPDSPPPSELLVLDLAPRPDIRQDNGVVSITINGTLRNTGKRTLELPPIRGVLRNDDGEELHNWRFQPTPSTLGPGEERPFRTIVNDPPAGTVEFELFVDWPEDAA